MVLAVGREIFVYPELLQIAQECGLFRGIEATERELNWAGILCEELGRTGGASLQLPPDGHDAGFDSIKARLQPVAHCGFVSPEERRYRALRRGRKVSGDNRTHLPAKTGSGPVSQSKPSARPQDTRHLRNNGRGERRKRDPEHRNQHVETGVWVGKRFGKAFVEADAKSFASRARSSLLQQMRRHIQAGHDGASAGNGRVTLPPYRRRYPAHARQVRARSERRSPPPREPRFPWLLHQNHRQSRARAWNP